MTETRRHLLKYDALLSKNDTWRLTLSGSDIKAGIEVKLTAGGLCHHTEVSLRWRLLVKGAVFIAPANSDRTTWVTQPVRVLDLLPLMLQLDGAPDHVIATMSEW